MSEKHYIESKLKSGITGLEFVVREYVNPKHIEVSTNWGYSAINGRVFLIRELSLFERLSGKLKALYTRFKK